MTGAGWLMVGLLVLGVGAVAALVLGLFRKERRYLIVTQYGTLECDANGVREWIAHARMFPPSFSYTISDISGIAGDPL